MGKFEFGLRHNIEIISPVKENIKQDVENGRQILLQEYEQGSLPSYQAGIIAKLRNYKPGTSKKVDAALYYLNSSVSDCSNSIPRRIKIEIGMQNLEGILR
ncbi:MAG: hypothetical protein V1886_02285 [archaeon]